MRPELSSDRATVSVASPGLRRRMDGMAGSAVLERVLSGWTARCVALVATYVAVSYVVAAAIGLPIHWLRTTELQAD